MKSDQTPPTNSSDVNQTDCMLAALWTEVLQLTSPPRAGDNFFSLGGDSMTAVTLEFRIHEELSIHLSPGTLFRAPTLGELSRVVDCLMGRADAAQDSSPSAPGDRDGLAVIQT